MIFMKEYRSKPEDVNKKIDVTRSQNRQAQESAKDAPEGEEHRSKGSIYKGTPKHKHGSHAEGEYSKQSDNPTMHPTSFDEV